jgi:hypothetical protein
MSCDASASEGEFARKVKCLTSLDFALGGSYRNCKLPLERWQRVVLVLQG